MNNFIVIVLDGVGIGELPDAEKYNDKGSNTIVNIAEAVGGLKLPNLESFGLGNIEQIKGIEKVSDPKSSYGKMSELSEGKDSTTCHWEIAGLHVKTDFSYFPNGFDDGIIKRFLRETDCKGILGNKPAGIQISRTLDRNISPQKRAWSCR